MTTYRTHHRTDHYAEHRDELTQQLADLRHMMEMSPDQRATIWRQIAEDDAGEFSPRQTADAAISPMHDVVKSLIPEHSYGSHPDVYHGVGAVSESFHHWQRNFAEALHHAADNPSPQAYEAVDYNYRQATAFTAGYANTLSEADPETAYSYVAQRGVLHHYLDTYHEFDRSPHPDHFRNDPVNFSTIHFVENFPTADNTPLHTLFYADQYGDNLPERWSANPDPLWENSPMAEQDILQEATAIAATFHDAVANYPHEDPYTGINRLSDIIAQNVSRRFRERVHTAYAMVEADHSEDDFHDRDDYITVAFEHPNHERVYDTIVDYFDEQMDLAEQRVVTALTENDPRALIDAVENIAEVTRQADRVHDYSDFALPTLDSTEHDREFQQLFAEYRADLIEQMLDAARNHVDDGTTLREAVERIEFRPQSALFSQIQQAWLDENPAP